MGIVKANFFNEVTVQKAFNARILFLSTPQMYDWLNERLLIASEETYRDLSNIQGKVMKHRAFEAEIQANKERLDNICEVSQRVSPKASFLSVFNLVVMQLLWMAMQCV